MFETLVMADSTGNFATAAGVMVGLGVLLFVVRARRRKEAKTEAKTFGREDREKKVKYDSNGKPIS
jgi:hypothetical protein